ncbi:hypothetical protein [Streptomyces otsuchiensis]|nr:hypothetical protein [Streptomyces otsuchiensis]
MSRTARAVRAALRAAHTLSAMWQCAYCSDWFEAEDAPVPHHCGCPIPA